VLLDCLLPSLAFVPPRHFLCRLQWSPSVYCLPQLTQYRLSAYKATSA
jgi:hypothetical protein